MELHLSSLEEGCCPTLNKLKTIDFDEYKSVKTVYLYCKTGTPADKIANLIFNSQKRKDKIIECSQLEKYLEQNSCLDK